MTVWKKSLICGCSFIVALFANIAFDLACGPEPDPYDYYVSFFHNTAHGNEHYRPFYYNGYLLLNDEREPVDEQQINVDEWAGYLTDKDVKRHDIKKALYELDSTASNTYFKSTRQPLPDSLKYNTFLNALRSNKYSKTALPYLTAVKAVEPLIKTFDIWDARPLDKTALIAEGENYFAQAAGVKNDSFLQLRYYYQAQRLLHYGGDYAKAAKIYDTHIANYRSTSHVKGWALALKAGELLHLGDSVKSAYLFSKVFAEYPERRVQAYHNFFYSKADIRSVLKLAANAAERANIYAIHGFHTPQTSLTALTEVYQTAPKSPLLNVLLLRELNKLEESYLTPRLTNTANYGAVGYYSPNSSDSALHAYTRYIPQLKAYCNKLADEGKAAEPSLFRLASAYLSWMSGDTTGGLAELDKLSAANLAARLDDQRQMINLLLLSQSLKKIDVAAENRLLPSLQWLARMVKQEQHIKPDSHSDYSWSQYTSRYYSASSRDFYMQVLAPIYLRQKDTVRAALAILHSQQTVTPNTEGYIYSADYANSDFWQTSLHSWHIRQIMRWQADKSKSPYLAALMKDAGPLMQNRFYQLLGTTYLREHRYHEAAVALSRLPKAMMKPDSIWFGDTAYPVNPFTDQLRDYPKAHVSKQAFTQLRFAKTMAALEQQTKAQPKNPANFYAMATGLYNVTYYGNAWSYTSFAWSADDYERKPQYYYDRDYLQARTAERYYLKARSLSTDAEFKAKCTFMAAKCRQKQYPYPQFGSYLGYGTPEYDRRQKNFDALLVLHDKQIRANDYFVELKKNYSQTKLFKTAVNECSYLRDFLSSQPAAKPIKKRVVVTEGK